MPDHERRTHPLGQLRLGVNIDHVATIRNARGGGHPDPVHAARIAEAAGADGITAHLREDRRHITDTDIEALMGMLRVPLNFEMAATDEMQAIALKHQPHAVCIVPEKREERTTEGGLDVAADDNRLAHFIAPLREAGCRISIFIAADRRQVEAARRIGAPVVELHAGAYCDAHNEGRHRDRDDYQHNETVSTISHNECTRATARPPPRARDPCTNAVTDGQRHAWPRSRNVA